jgi:hypothetical protein
MSSASSKKKKSGTAKTVPPTRTQSVGRTTTKPLTPASARPTPSVPLTMRTPTRPGTVSRPLTATATNVRQPVAKAARPAVTSGKGQLRRQQAAQQEQQRRLQLVLGALGAVVVIIGFFIIIAHNPGNNNGSSGIGSVAPANVAKAVTTVPSSVLSTVKTGGLANPLIATNGAPPVIKDAQGKPIVFYAGGEFCPYCAAERWSMIVALSRFGTFSNLHLMQSASDDVYANTSTFTFVGSTYTSTYLDFQPVETSDRNQNALQTFSAAQQQWFATYDAPPYTSQAGGIPFISFGNQYLTISSGYLPDVLAGQSWQTIASGLTNASNPATVAIVGNANYLTAAICHLTQQQPASVCKTAPITAIQP